MLNLEILKSNQVSFDTKGLPIQDPRVWNALPFHIKSKENLQILKKLLILGRLKMLQYLF